MGIRQPGIYALYFFCLLRGSSFGQSPGYATGVLRRKFQKNFTKFLLVCNTPPGYDITDLFGSIMPPRENDLKKYGSAKNELAYAKSLKMHKDAISNLTYTYSEVYVRYVLDNLFYDLETSDIEK